MLYTRNIKFQYFQVRMSRIVDDCWDNGELYDLTKWIIKANDYKENLVEISFEGILARIEEIGYDETSKLWFLNVNKLRDTNIPNRVKSNEKAVGIQLEDDEYFGEDITFSYEKESHILMLQSNRFSITVSKLEKLLNKINDNASEKIQLLPIAFDLKANAYNAGLFRKIDVKFANLKDCNPDGRKPLGGVMKFIKKAGGVVGSIQLSLGHSSETTLNRTETKTVLDEVYANREFIKSAKITIKDDDNAKPEVIDLFDNVANDIIEFQLPSRETLKFEDVVSKMAAKYNDRKKELYKGIGYKKE